MDYLLIAATPLLLGGVGLAIIYFRKLSWADDVGFKAPALGPAALWVAAFLVYAVAVELLASGESMRGSWTGKYGAADLALRIAAVAFIYPVVEEFFFRGVFFGVLRRRFGGVVAVLVPAVIFGAIHVQYDWPVIIVLDGIFFGLCRWHSGSVYLPMLLHALGNSYAVWERLQ